MVINLDKAFSVGDLSPDQTFPSCYIVKFGSYGSTATLTVTYEFGTMKAATDDQPQQWIPCPFNTQTRLTFSGQRLAPFYTTMGDPSEPLWVCVETLIYQQIQANDSRCAGTLAANSP